MKTVFARWSRPSIAAFCLALAFPAAADTGVPELKSLLLSVVAAVRSENYRGRLTYEHSGKLEVLEVAHAVIDGREYERVSYLNGPDRAVVKRGRVEACTARSEALLAGVNIQLANGTMAQLENSYSPIFLGVERLLGREAWMLQLIPKDKNRHSLILAVDQQSHLPLKMLVVADGRKVLERMHFISLDTAVGLVRGDFVDEPVAAKTQAPVSCRDLQAVATGSRWQPQWLPPGYVLAAYSYSQRDGHMETYTDGLASFSVFVKPLVSDSERSGFLPVSTRVKKGATVILMRLLADQSEAIQVSLLGEIPGHTAAQVIASVAAVASSH